MATTAILLAPSGAPHYQVVVRRVNRRRLLLWPAAAAAAADQQSLLQPHLRLMFLNKHYDSIIFTFADARLSRHAAR